MEKTRTRCMGCQAPIQFQPGAGSRLCPFCGHINLVREQLVAAPTLELKTDEVFKLMQAGELEKALKLAESVSDDESQNFRLAFYRACILFDMEQVTEAVYTLIDLTGVDAAIGFANFANSSVPLCKFCKVLGRCNVTRVNMHRTHKECERH